MKVYRWGITKGGSAKDQDAVKLAVRVSALKGKHKKKRLLIDFLDSQADCDLGLSPQHSVSPRMICDVSKIKRRADAHERHVKTSVPNRQITPSTTKKQSKKLEIEISALPAKENSCWPKRKPEMPRLGIMITL